MTKNTAPVFSYCAPLLAIWNAGAAAAIPDILKYSAASNRDFPDAQLYSAQPSLAEHCNIKHK
jgi:hypothetical protein